MDAEDIISVHNMDSIYKESTKPRTLLQSSAILLLEAPCRFDCFSRFPITQSVRDILAARAGLYLHM